MVSFSMDSVGTLGYGSIKRSLTIGIQCACTYRLPTTVQLAVCSRLVAGGRHSICFERDPGLWQNSRVADVEREALSRVEMSSRRSDRP
jgi:hypothetical protein